MSLWEERWSQLNSELEDYWDVGAIKLDKTLELDISSEDLEVLLKIARALGGESLPPEVVASIFLRHALRAWGSGRLEL